MTQAENWAKVQAALAREPVTLIECIKDTPYFVVKGLISTWRVMQYCPPADYTDDYHYKTDEFPAEYRMVVWDTKADKFNGSRINFSGKDMVYPFYMGDKYRVSVWAMETVDDYERCYYAVEKPEQMEFKSVCEFKAFKAGMEYQKGKDHVEFYDSIEVAEVDRFKRLRAWIGKGYVQRGEHFTDQEFDELCLKFMVVHKIAGEDLTPIERESTKEDHFLWMVTLFNHFDGFTVGWAAGLDIEGDLIFYDLNHNHADLFNPNAARQLLRDGTFEEMFDHQTRGEEWREDIYGEKPDLSWVHPQVIAKVRELLKEDNERD
jgi:hypothetical protein